MSNLFSYFEFRLFLAICLVILMVWVTLDFIFKVRENHLNDKEADDFRNDQGNHVYYDRSLIRKQKFIKDHPDVNPDDVRSFKRLFKKETKKQN